MDRPISLTRNRAILAISSGMIYRPSGILCNAKSSLWVLCIIGVAVGPGAIPFTVMPSGPSAFANPRVRARNPHLLKVYAESAGLKLDAEAILRILPFIWFSFRGLSIWWFSLWWSFVWRLSFWWSFVWRLPLGQCDNYSVIEKYAHFSGVGVWQIIKILLQRQSIWSLQCDTLDTCQ